MPGRRERASRGRTTAARPGIALAIYHVTRDFESHVAPLRRSGRFRLTCKLQRSASRALLTGFDGVLWELVPGKAPDRRRLAFLARGIAVVSYSARGGREIADLSRGLGFKAHLKAPLRAAEVARVLRPAPRRALAERLGPVQSALGRRLRRVDVLADVVR